MSLEDKIDRLTKAVEALTAALLSQQQAAPIAQIKPQPATQAKVETAPSSTTESQTEDVTADLRTFIANISREKHENVRDRVRNIFKQFGAEKLSDVKESDYEELVKALTKEFYGEQI